MTTQLEALRTGGAKKCQYGDPFCPCQDGDTCHYEGRNPMKPSKPAQIEVPQVAQYRKNLS